MRDRVAVPLHRLFDPVRARYPRAGLPEAILSALSPAPFASAIAEIRLDEIEFPPDLSLLVEPEGLARAMPVLDRLAAGSEIWRRTAAFARSWRDRPIASGLWLEFDHAATKRGVEPLLYVMPGGDRHACAETEVRRLLDREAGGLDRLPGILDRFGGAVRVLSLGSLAARGPGRRLRASLRLAEFETAARVAEAAGWPGDAAAVAPLAELFRPFARLHALDLDLSAEDCGETLGVEFVPVRRFSWNGASRSLFERLAARGYAREEAVERAAAWPGASMVEPPGGLFPLFALRSVSHLKAVLTPGRAPRIKAYLEIQHRAAASI